MRVGFLLALLLLNCTPQILQQGLKPFGFSGIEFYRVARDSRCLICRDIDQDGLLDIIVANNQKASIDILIQKTQEELAKTKDQPPHRLNQLPSDLRYRLERLHVEKRIYSLAVGDLNGDGRLDLAYYGDPPELVIVYQTEGGWGKQRLKFRIKDGINDPGALVAVDLNGDARTDLALLTKEQTYILYQTREGKLGYPESLPNIQKNISSIRVCDLNGDGRKDLVYIKSGPRPISVRLQTKEGIGPAYVIPGNKVRSIACGDLDLDGADELVFIDDVIGRVHVYKWQRVKGPGLLATPQIIPLPKGLGRHGDPVIGDIDGDGFKELIVPYHNSARVQILSDKSQASFPSLLDVRSIDIIPDGGQGNILGCLSPKEGVLGISRWKDGTLTLPKTYSMEGRPLCLARFEPGGLIALLEKGKKGVFLNLVSPMEDRIKSILKIRLEGITKDPKQMTFFDIDQDGKRDLILFTPYEPLRILLNRGEPERPKFVPPSDGSFQHRLLQDTYPSSFFTTDMDQDGRPEFLIGKKNLLRVMRIDRQGQLEILFQVNTRGPNGRVKGAVALDLDGDKSNEIVIFDEAEKRLSIYKLRKGGYSILDEIELGVIKFCRLMLLDFDRDGKKDIVVVGEEAVCVILCGAGSWGFQQILSYQTEIPKARLELVGIGDLNDDGHPELMVTESSEKLWMVLVPEGERFKKVFHFKVYEGKAIGAGAGVFQLREREPREMLARDVTGDGKQDLVLLIHDRIIVYPQE
jgi:hypothetical protein